MGSHGRIGCLVLVIALVTSLALVGIAPVRAVCRSRVASILFHVWNAQGTVVFNGNSYTEGSSTSISWGCGQSYSISYSWIGSNFAFRQWGSDAGTFQSQTSQSTTFYPAGNSGAIAMVTYYIPSSISNWGGYVADIASSPPGTTSWSSYATFKLPTSIHYQQAPNSGSDRLVAWVALGGCSLPPPCASTDALWQGGLSLALTSGNSVTIHPFTDECGSTTSCNSAYVWAFPNPTYNVALGDSVYMQLSYSSSSGVSYYIQDLGPGNTWTIQGGCPGYCYSNFIPATDTAEWIVEAPTANSFLSDCGVPAGSQCVFPNFGTITVPNNSFGTTPLSADWSLGIIRMMGSDGSQTGGYANPGLFTNGPVSNSGGWSVTWATSPG